MRCDQQKSAPSEESCVTEHAVDLVIDEPQCFLREFDVLQVKEHLEDIDALLAVNTVAVEERAYIQSSRETLHREAHARQGLGDNWVYLRVAVVGAQCEAVRKDVFWRR